MNNSHCLWTGFFKFQNELHYHDVITLKLDDCPADGPDGTQLVTLGICPNSYMYIFYFSKK